MRFLLFIVFAALPVCVKAQNGFDLVFGGGLSTAYASGPQLRTTVPALGATAVVKTIWDTRKWQVGAGVDFGVASHGTVERDVVLVVEHNNTVVSYANTRVEDAPFATPYFSPHALVNYKLNIPDRLYFYGGAVLGYTFTRQGFDMKPDGANTYYRNVRGLVTGTNLGLVINFGGRVSLDLSESWRMSFLKEPSPAGYRALEKSKRTGYANHMEYFDAASLITEYNLHVFLTTVALRISL